MSNRTAARLPSDAPMRGLALMLFASGSFVTMNTLSSSLGRGGCPWQAAAFARAFVGCLAAFAFARARGASLRVGNRRVMWVRSLAGSTSLTLTFFALTHLPLADATALLNTTPLWTALLAYVTLREAAGRSVLLALAVALAGVLLIQRVSIASGQFAGLVALAAGLSSATAMVSLRRLHNETPEAVVVHFSAVASVLTGGLLALALHHGARVPLDALSVAKLLGVGVTATAGQLAMTRAYGLDRAARVGAASWVQVVLALVLDVVVLGRVPGARSLLGIGLMVAAGVVLTLGALRDDRRLRAERDAATPLPVR